MHIPKTKIAKFLEITRNTFDKRLADKKWKTYQTERINFIHNELSIIKSEIKSVKLNDGKLIITVQNEPSVRIYNLEVNLK